MRQDWLQEPEPPWTDEAQRVTASEVRRREMRRGEARRGRVSGLRSGTAQKQVLLVLVLRTDSKKQ